MEDELRERGDWLGASCVPRWRDAGLVFAARVEGPRLVLSGIGGKVEPGETFAEAMRREFREETGREPGPLVTVPPRHLTEESVGHPVPDGAAALIVERPAAHPTGGALWIAVFLARLDEPPMPVEKIRTFIVVDPRRHRPLRLDRLSAVAGDAVVPAAGVLPPTVTAVDAEHTARAVLGRPGLLAEWWAAA